MPNALSDRYPELADIDLRRGGLPPRIAGWFLGERSVAAITLWNTVFLGASEPISPELLLHEARHVQQFGADWSFPVRYLVESVRRGYHRNRFEVDARAYADRRLRGDDQRRGAP
ncbi:MAG: hypothetical protein M3081_01345 [Gemmatimonadota bacterium]|nr:hypothetical protein [Gemmatimonadota bacterium]